MNSKKGVSPLIATVLLLAFAVAIATIIVQLEPFTGGCSIFSAKVSEIDGKMRMCYDSEAREIQIFLANGKYDISGIKASIEGEKDVKNTFVEVAIEKHTASKIGIPYEMNKFGLPTSIILTPAYDKGDSITECPLIINMLEDFSECK